MYEKDTNFWEKVVMYKLVKLFEAHTRITLEDKMNEWLLFTDVHIISISYTIYQERYGALVYYNQEEYDDDEDIEDDEEATDVTNDTLQD